MIAAIGFEIERLLASCGNGPLKLLQWPGFLVQKITTIEPDDAQLEVALAALRATLRRELGARANADGDATFESFESLASETPSAA